MAVNESDPFAARGPAGTPAGGAHNGETTRPARGRLGIVCYPTSGGSGIVATELGLALAHRGWEVHFITYAMPIRLKGYEENVYFHEVMTDNYPVFHHPPYTLALAVKITEVAETHGLDVLHVHYALPHAVCAYLAVQMLPPGALRTVTTLHGTDITLVGVQPSFHKITRFSIEKSDRVTAVSDFLRRMTFASFGVEKPIEVIHNFVDHDRFRPGTGPAGHLPFVGQGRRIVMHASNFRPVKNVPTVIRTFAGIAAQVPANLVLLGDGPERWHAQDLARSFNLQDRVFFLGVQERIEELLPLADLFLLPSAHESFGLVALEAMSCGVPVIATSRGGTSELITHSVSGFLVDPEDEAGMIETGVRVLRDPGLQQQVAHGARARVEANFTQDTMVDRYEALYRGLLGEQPAGRP
jgi:L-malate glycosyltransferase